MDIRNVNNGTQQQVGREALFELFDLADELLGLIDPDGAFVRVNNALGAFLGAEGEHISGLFLDHFHAADRAEAAEALQRAAAGEAASLIGQFQGGDGTFRRVRWKLSAAGGTLLAAGRRLAETRPLTASQEVRQRELLDILESAPDFIGFTDVRGRTQYLNPAGRAMMGFGMDEDLTDLAMSDYLAPESLAALDDMVAATRRDGLWRGETIFQTRTGQKIPTSQALIAHKNEDGEVERFSTIVRDIRAQKAAEERLSQQARQLAVVNEVSTAVATILEVDRLLQRTMDLTRQRFDLYHAHIYLLSAGGDQLLLTAGAGDVGRQMVAEGRQIPLDAERSLVARVARERAGLIANDVREEPDFLPHPLLPETRSELAVPVVVGDKLVGVLDVQAAEAGRFSGLDVNALTTLAAQIAIAVENARSFEQAQQALAELDLVTQRLTREGWERYMEARKRAPNAFFYDDGEIQPMTEAGERPPVDTDPDAPPATNGQRLAQPLQIHGATVGRLALEQESELAELDEESAAIVAAVAGQLSARIENLRLTEQTQTALMTTERQAERLAELNELGAALSTAPTLDDLLQQAGQRTAEIVGGDRITISLYDAESRALQFYLMRDDEAHTLQRLETPYSLSGSPLAQIFATGRIFYREDLREEGVGDALPAAEDLRSIVVAPLIGREQPVGTVNVGSMEPGAFTEDDRSILRQLASLLAATIENRRLSSETERHASQLEQLAEVEAALSQATTEDELLAALASHFAGDGTSATITLNYVETDKAGHPTTASTMAVWQDGGLLPDSPLRGREQSLSALPVAKLWIEQPYEPLLIADVQSDPRVDDEMARQASATSFRALAVIPLYSGRQWQGNVTFTWPEPHAFSPEESFLIQQLLEPLSATIAGRRAYLAQQEALTETAALYRAGSELNRARTYDDVLGVLRRHTLMGEARSLSALVMFDTVWTETEEPESLDVAALWTPVPVEDAKSSYKLVDLPTARRLLRPDAPVLFEDIRTDERVGEDLRNLFIEQFRGRAGIVVPLVVGGQWIGYAIAVYRKPMTYPDEHVRRLLTMVGQAAVAIQSISLLEETGRLLASEQRQRRIADTMLRATERMSGILDETQIREIMVDEIHTLLRPAQVNLYQWLPAEEAFVPLEQVGVPGASKARYPLGVHVSRADAPELWEPFSSGRPVLKLLEAEEGSQREAYRVGWLIGSERAGVLEILRPAGAVPMRDEDRASVVGMVQQAAIRLQNARLFSEAEVRAEELAVLNEMGRALTALTDVESVIETAYRYTGRLMDATNFYVSLYDAEADMLTFPLAVDHGERVTYPSRPYGAGFTEHLIEKGEPLLLNENILEYMASIGIDQYGEEAHSWLGVPIVFGDRIMGVIGLQSYTRKGAYDEHAREILGSIASQTAIAIQNAELFEEIQERVAETQTLYETSRAINTSQSFGAILEALQTHTFLRDAHHLSLNYFDRPWTEDEEPEMIRVLARNSVLPPEALRPAYEFSSFPSREHLDKREPVLIENVEESPLVDERLGALLDALQARSTLFIPLVAGGQWLGLIHGVFREQTAFPEREVERLSALTGQAAVAIQGLQLLHDAQQRVRREQILREVTASVRSVTDVELIMKTAARQVGQALGRETFVYLGGDGDSETHTPPAGEEGN